MIKRSSISRMYKAFETKVAKDFGTVRNPLSGKNSRHDTSSDSLHLNIYIEAKRDQSYFGKKLLVLIGDTIKKAKREQKIPMIALKRKDKQSYFILCQVNDLKKLSREKWD